MRRRNAAIAYSDARCRSLKGVTKFKPLSVGRFSSLHACLPSVSRALTDQIIVRCRISEYRFQGSSPFRLPIILFSSPRHPPRRSSSARRNGAASSSSRDHLPEMINRTLAGSDAKLFGRPKIMLEKSTAERTKPGEALRITSSAADLNLLPAV